MIDWLLLDRKTKPKSFYEKSKVDFKSIGPGRGSFPKVIPVLNLQKNILQSRKKSESDEYSERHFTNQESEQEFGINSKI